MTSDYLKRPLRSELDATHAAWQEALAAWEKTDRELTMAMAREALAKKANDKAKQKAHEAGNAWARASRKDQTS